MANNGPNGRYTRRQALKLTGASGALLTAGHPVTALSNDDVVDIPIAKRGDKVLSTVETSRTWWNHVLECRKARESLESRFSDNPAVERVSTVEAPDTLAGNPKRRLQVDVNEAEINLPSFVERQVPTEHQGFEVTTNSVNPVETNCINTDPFDPVPGGVQMVNQDIYHPRWDEYAHATFGCPVKYEGQTYMLTAEHNADEGVLINQSDNQYFGTGTSIRNSTLDYQLVELGNPYIDMSCKVTWGSGSAPILGHATNPEMISTTKPIYKVGVMSGLTQGSIVGVAGDEVVLSNTNIQGDSGGPLFFGNLPTGPVYILGITSGGDPGGENEWCDGRAGIYTTDMYGPTAEAIHNDNSSSIVFGDCS